MATQPEAPFPPPLDSILGASLIGLVVSSVIYGISVLQTYLYYTRYSHKDKAFLKTFVAILLVLDTAQLCFVLIYTYHYEVSYFGRFDVLEVATWSLMINFPVGALLTTCVQGFFAYRIYQLSGQRYIIPVTIFVLSLGQMACAIAYMVDGTNKLVSETAQRLKMWTEIALPLDIVCDFLIVSSMVILLLRRRTGFTRTHRMISLLITYLVNSCLLVTICTVVSLALFVQYSGANYNGAVYFIAVKLYCCTFLSTLNSREGLKEELSGGSKDFISLSHLAGTTTKEGKSYQNRTPGYLSEVQVDVETVAKAV